MIVKWFFVNFIFTISTCNGGMLRKQEKLRIIHELFLPCVGIQHAQMNHPWQGYLKRVGLVALWLPTYTPPPPPPLLNHIFNIYIFIFFVLCFVFLFCVLCLIIIFIFIIVICCNYLLMGLWLNFSAMPQFCMFLEEKPLENSYTVLCWRNFVTFVQFLIWLSVVMKNEVPCIFIMVS